MEKKGQINAYSLLVILQCLIFALIDVFGKIAYQYVSVASFITIRFLIATLLIFALYGKTIISDFKNGGFKYCIFPGLSLSVSVIFSCIGIKLATVTSYSFIRCTSCIMAPILLCIFSHRKYTLFDLVLQSSLLVGLYLLCAKGGLDKFGAGEILAFLAAILVACTLVYGSDAVKHVSPRTLSAVQMMFGLIISIPYGLITKQYAQTDFSLYLTWNVMGPVLFNGIVGTCVVYSLQNISLAHVSPKIVGIFQSAYPVFAALVAFIVLGERLSGAGLIGVTIILACVLVQGLINEDKNA